jgi:two-component system chemotaxis sensor kinase CheA
MNELDEIVNEFVIESHEGLDVLDRELLALERDPHSPEALGAIFRTIHSIKGACGFLGFTTLESVAHVGESLLSRLRDGVIAFTPEMASALLSLSDAIRDMLATIEATGGDGNRDHRELVDTLTDLNEGRLPAAPVLADAPTPESPPTATAASDPVDPAPEPPAATAPPPPAPAEPPPVEPPPVEPPPVAGAVPVPADAGSVVLSESIAAPPAAAPETRSRIADSTIRVEVNVLDNLMTLVGELVLARNELVQLVSEQQDGLLTAAAQRLSLITTELQEGAMKTRMQPIATVTAKLPRVVRDLAKSTGKTVRFEVEGEETELDKSIIEAISDPLTHLVRNAVDHGVEAPEARVAAGKPAEAVLTLHAYHEGGKVNIEISDDGAGIDLDRVRAKALEKGILPASTLDALAEREILEIIFAAGFSTAEKVTNTSGRGVGMDVVRSNIERIGGSVEAHSVPHRGTTFKIKIPLTLAIIPALFVDSAGERFAIPQVNVLELVRLEADDATQRIESMHGAPVYRLRGRLLPLLYLRRELGQPDPDATGVPRAVNIVVLQTDEQQFGMVVESVSDSAEIVVKPLGAHLKAIATYAGSTIMGDGKVALILDVMGLAVRAELLRDATSRALIEASAAIDDRAGDHESLLLLATPDDGRLAIPLGAVDRLEKFSPTIVESIGDREVVQYRDLLLPLVRVSDVLVDRRRSPRGPQSDHVGDDSLHVVVHRHGDRRVGIVVERILDVVEQAMELDPATRRGVIGTMVIQGRATEVLDVEALLELAGAGIASRVGAAPGR